MEKVSSSPNPADPQKLARPQDTSNADRAAAQQAGGTHAADTLTHPRTGARAAIGPFPSMTVTQKFPIIPQFLDRRGNKAPVDGAPTYASSNEAAARVVADPGGLTAWVIAQGVGDYTISVAADADLGSGSETIVGSQNGSVSLGKATNVDIAVGDVVEQDGTEPVV